jgi:hypothetical protein
MRLDDDGSAVLYVHCYALFSLLLSCYRIDHRARSVSSFLVLFSLLVFPLFSHLVCLSSKDHTSGTRTSLCVSCCLRLLACIRDGSSTDGEQAQGLDFPHFS